MLFLWIFGNNVEDAMGHVKFVVFYLLGGLAAIGAQILIEPNAAIPTIGASGAVAAVLGGYILLVSAGPRRHGHLHHLLLHDRRAAGAADPRLLVLAAGRVRRLRPRQPDRRRGRRRVLRAHRRVRRSGCGDQALRQPHEGLQPAAEVPRVLSGAPRSSARRSLFIAILAALTVVAVLAGGFNVLTLVIAARARAAGLRGRGRAARAAAGGLTARHGRHHGSVAEESRSLVRYGRDWSRVARCRP